MPHRRSRFHFHANVAIVTMSPILLVTYKSSTSSLYYYYFIIIIIIIILSRIPRSRYSHDIASNFKIRFAQIPCPFGSHYFPVITENTHVIFIYTFQNMIDSLMTRTRISKKKEKKKKKRAYITIEERDAVDCPLPYILRLLRYSTKQIPPEMLGRDGGIKVNFDISAACTDTQKTV